MKINLQKGMTNGGVIAIVVVVIILAIIAVASMNSTENTTGGTNTTNNNTSGTGSPTTPSESITFSLSEQNNSNQSGTVVISNENGRARILISMTGSTTNAAQPAHVHTNACANIGSVVYPLNDVVNGTSLTVLNVSVDQLFSSLPRSINVHKSAAESDVYVACGNLTVR